RGTGSGQKPTCFKCGVQGHFKRECPKLKNNKNRGNQVGNDRAPAKVYVVGHAGTNPDSNIVTGTFLLNNRYVTPPKSGRSGMVTMGCYFIVQTHKSQKTTSKETF
ncbi:putative reverse transcriptase domain-containing protein, partial [Tanacetum coccineum]